MLSISITKKPILSQEQLFMLSVLTVNGGNYLYNLLLGRILGPEQFSDAAILITMLLVLSFVAMTFQLAAAKFTVTLSETIFGAFVKKIYKNAVMVGIFFGAMVVVFAKDLQGIFHTSSSMMFTIFGIGVPLYFLMSVNRGFFQGKKQFKLLSITYQAEMFTRLGLTLILVLLFHSQSSVVIAVGVLVSLVVGLFPLNFDKKQLTSKVVFPKKELAQVKKFFVITAFYELSQIIINNSDILLVKHYFEAYDAGLYASLALIGRIVYFVAWMFVMLLLPTVVQLKKEGKDTTKVLMKYVSYIAIIATTIVLACAMFPTLIVQMLFGNDYVEIAPLLWKYAFATGIFAVANIFAYYFLSLDKYIPVLVSAIFGALQVLLVVFYHASLDQVVHVQMLAMTFLLFTQVIFFFIDAKKVSTNGKK
ncbi:oligosaccharide flippase family protein [Wenyingzhuangia marina]|uniref:Membrane protein involved in the export of O-antigen and teichoic acid n=1 Tax=Wenyingzhuangia marina TaxID=1195760 RepID=A0A1M5WWI8_9FLAO|nr:oligosaccharide flippase family protein [Wenyingzhuangia marina]GGF82292.1 sugar isomerase [Wenyingzhuangia marina]SHH91678.1 Membrane protein involved in the export of O-antigen and teichoic acid [Wenyingzhuangia marina]